MPLPAEREEAFVRIPAGRFQMGSTEWADNEQPVHRVSLATFEIGACAVTRRAYARFLDATGHEAPRDWERWQTLDGGVAVTGVSWHDAVAYCGWLDEVRGRVGHRLPTEAEWERAARGGVDGQRYPWGEALPDWLPAGGRGPVEAPWAVTLGPPTGFGLYGIGANVHEWCADWYAADYYRVSPETDPRGPFSGERRVSRGGSWRHAVTISRTAARSRLDPGFRYADYGFRVARF
ncbi:MAG: formylglycine-generating enzyme family protein [Vicinamibacterales bacterium]